MNMRLITRTTAIGLTAALMAMPLVGCGTSTPTASTTAASSAAASTTAATSSTTQSGSAGSASASDSTDSSSDTETGFSIDESEVTEAYVGTDEAGEGVYWIGNADGSKAGLFILSSSGDYISFLGPTEVDGSVITIVDAVSGNACAIDVTNNGDGTLTFTGSIATTSGASTDFTANVASCDVDTAFSVVQQISQYANLVE